MDVIRDRVTLSDGTSLAIRRRAGVARPYVLVHGLASNARLWDLVSQRLGSAGHEVVAIDLRSHGESDRTPAHNSTVQASMDVSEVIDAMNWAPERAPIVVGQSWGANVVLHLASQRPSLHGVGAVDGGWIHLADQYATFDQCWQELAPPDLTSYSWTQVHERLAAMAAGWPAGALESMMANLEIGADGLVRNRLARSAHRQILHALWADDPAEWYTTMTRPTLFIVAGNQGGPRQAAVQAAVRATSARLRSYPDAHHDIHVQHPDWVSVDLLTLQDSTPGGVL